MKQPSVIDQEIVIPVHQDLKEEYLGVNHVLNMLPSAVYVCDASGKIINYNRKAVELWGRTPKKGETGELYCGSFRLYYPDGRYLPHHETPVAACLLDGLPREGFEVVMERPDLSRSIVRVSIVPIKDEAGNILGMINCFHDITGQKKTEKELGWKTEQLQDYVDNASIGLHWVDANGIIKWANKAEMDMLGYAEEEYVGHHISEFHVQQDKIDDILQRLGCNETLNQYESELWCKDGSIKTVHISSNVFWDEEKFIHTRCFTVDVTEQKKLFNSLRKSQERYKTLMSTLPTGVYTCNKDGKFTFYNDMAANLWGCRPKLIDTSFRFCGWHRVRDLEGNVIPAHQTPMALALQEKRSFRNIEAIAERENGELVYICVNIESVLDDSGNVTGAIVVFQDITALKQTELALRASESRYKKLIQSLDTPLYTTDAEGRLTLFNKAAADLWGREPELGRDLWCGSYKIFNTDGSNLPLEECPMAVCLKEQRSVYGEEIIVVRPDGSLRNVAPHPQPIFDDSGKMIGAINMLVDITEIKRKEQALLESEKKYRKLSSLLEKKVEEKTFDLKIKNAELRNSEEQLKKHMAQLEFQNKELEQFAYAASHDMKEPLRKIHFYNSFIAENPANTLDDKSHEFLSRSVNATNRMRDLIEDLLTYSKTTANVDQFEHVDLNKVVEEVELIHKEEFEQNKVQMQVDKLPVIQGITFQITQLFLNIISNSIKYKHPERNLLVQITIDVVKGSEINERAAEPHEIYQKISIIDNGIGFDQQYAEKIFNIFQRLSNGFSQGSGIGLAICKRIVQNHHGFIKAIGKENKGATFEIFLPQ